MPERSVAVLDMMLAAMVHRLAHLLSKTGRRKIGCVGRHQSPVQPGRAVRTDLLFKVEHRKDANAGLPVAVRIIGGGAPPAPGYDR